MMWLTFMAKNSKESRNLLLNTINQLKSDPVGNSDRINELEGVLNRALDVEMRHEVQKIQGFENLHNEKITPFFLKLAKSNKSEAKMCDIKDADGAPFNSPAEMKTYVTEFYASIYRKPDTEPDIIQGCIEQFLGEDICNHPVVVNSKIPDQESIPLEAFFTIQELDESVAQANKSASGLDGFSNCFIKKFWIYFRTPLLRYINCCMQKGRLTSTFNTGMLRLIPKKGDTSKVTNWRPISLLSCMYKVLSHALNNRLNMLGILYFQGSLKFLEKKFMYTCTGLVETYAKFFYNSSSAHSQLDESGLKIFRTSAKTIT